MAKTYWKFAIENGLTNEWNLQKVNDDTATLPDATRRNRMVYLWQRTGRADNPLTKNGEDGARQLNERISTFSFKHVLTSPVHLRI